MANMAKLEKILDRFQQIGGGAIYPVSGLAKFLQLRLRLEWIRI